MTVTKKELRRYIATQKKAYTRKELEEYSSQLLQQIEQLDRFRQATSILLYYSLPDEVQTQKFIDKWSREKEIILPVVKGNELELRKYTGKDNLTKGSFGIEEPEGEPLSDYGRIDLALIPGVGFDTQGNRLGRGKGYYDRLLPKLKAYKIGICFQFQVQEYIPAEPFDMVMDEVWSEKGRISKIQF